MSNCKSKSPGPDNIPYSFIQNLPSNGVPLLLKILNTTLNNRIFPDQWRNAIFIPIPKPNKNKFDIGSQLSTNLTHKYNRKNHGKTCK